MCSQKVYHLALGLPMVQCSHIFVKINLYTQLLWLDLDERNNINIVDKKNEENILGDVGSASHVGNQKNHKHHESIKKRILDAYSHRFNYFL